MAVLGDTKAISLTLLDGVIGDLNPKVTTTYNLGTSSLKWNNIYGTLKGNADTATKAGAANITTNTNGVAYYTNTTGTFGNIRAASGAFYSTGQDTKPVFGTLPVAQGGTGQTSIANIQAGKDGSGNTITSYYVTLSTAQTISGAKTFSSPIYFGRSGSNGILTYNASNPNYGIWYHDEATDSMTFSASGKANNKTTAELCITGGVLYTANKLIPNTGNTTGTVGSSTQPVYVNAGTITAITGALDNDISGNAATATAISPNGTTAQFWRGDNGWSNTIKQTENAALGIDTNLKIGTARKDLNFDIANGSGSGINDGYAGGITWGSDASAYAGIYYQTSGAYGSRLHFATTNSYANGAYTRMLIASDGKVGIGTLTPSTALHVIGDITASGLTASQAVSTDANKKLVSTNLTVSDPTASGTGITYIATISQSAVGKITVTKSTVRSASTSQTGVLQFTTANTNAQLNTLTTGSSTPIDADYYISQYVGGGTTTTTYHRRPMSALWDYIKGKITDGIYWANEKATSSASYKTTPEVANIKINGNTAATAASTQNVQLTYDSTLEVLNFVFS